MRSGSGSSSRMRTGTELALPDRLGAAARLLRRYLSCMRLDEILVLQGSPLLGAAFAAIPGYLQAKRDSHIVITTIMFNYIATALMSFLLVNVFKVPGSMAPESRGFPANASVPQLHELLRPLGLNWPATPLNLSFLLALGCASALAQSSFPTTGGAYVDGKVLMCYNGTVAAPCSSSGGGF